MKDKVKEFNLEDSIASGPLAINEGGGVDLSNITLLDKKQDCLIHIEYLPKQRIYVF
ncbi:MAG: hypothetical protein NTZ83_03475 [Candidatus Pacearchaeota archaeon]|nr:hypothetical protein [Candidatus Pacearchaeota archaeon]